MDIGETFLNFMLGKELCPYSGVDVTHIRTQRSDLQHHDPEPLPDIPEREKERIRAWERWGQNWMGMIDSPKRLCHMMIIVKEVAFGDRQQQTNPFMWHMVVLNLPGMGSYDTKMPWVYKQQKDGVIANDCFIYVDGKKLTGSTPLECWKSGCRFSWKLTNLGVQDAKRKRTSPTLTPGPWAGSVVHTKGGIFSLVSAKRWVKTKELIVELLDLLDTREDGQLPHHRLLQIRGFLVYMSWSYPWMPLYLKGRHLTIDSWRPGRGKDGYKLKDTGLREQPFILWRWETEEWINLDQKDYEKVSGERLRRLSLCSQWTGLDRI
jgi:hypothetical protein